MILERSYYLFSYNDISFDPLNIMNMELTIDNKLPLRKGNSYKFIRIDENNNNPFNIGTEWRENNSEIVFDISSAIPNEGILYGESISFTIPGNYNENLKYFNYDNSFAIGNFNLIKIDDKYTTIEPSYIYENCGLTGGSTNDETTSISAFSTWFGKKGLIWDDSIYRVYTSYKGWYYNEMNLYK